MKSQWDSFKEYPFWYYENVTLQESGVSLPPQYIFKNIKMGYDYLMNGFLFSVPQYIDIAITDIAPTMKIEVIQPGRGRDLLITPTPLDLFSSPGSKMPDGRDRKKTNFLPFNYLFSNKEAFVLRLTGHVGGEPHFIRLVVLGRNILREK